jgi:hypothetical protein
MPFMWLVARHVDRQKRELIEFLRDLHACDPEHAVDLAGAGVKPSILRSLLSRKVVRQTPAGKFYLDPAREHEAYGASNRFILYALGATILGILAIMLL